jgi:hypothetical protein
MKIEIKDIDPTGVTNKSVILETNLSRAILIINDLHSYHVFSRGEVRESTSSERNKIVVENWDFRGYKRSKYKYGNEFEMMKDWCRTLVTKIIFIKNKVKMDGDVDIDYIISPVKYKLIFEMLEWYIDCKISDIIVEFDYEDNSDYLLLTSGKNKEIFGRINIDNL